MTAKIIHEDIILANVGIVAVLKVIMTQICIVTGEFYAVYPSNKNVLCGQQNAAVKKNDIEIQNRQ